MHEKALIIPLDTWLVGEFGPLQRRHTIAKLLDQTAAGASAAAPATPVGPTVIECDAKLARYRAALEAGANPAVVAGWIAATQAERLRAEQHQQAATVAKAPDKASDLTEKEIIAIIEELGDLVTALRDADPEHKMEVDRNLGLRLTYDPETQTVRANVDLAMHRWDLVRVRGEIDTVTPHATAPVADIVICPGSAALAWRSAVTKLPSATLIGGFQPGQVRRV